MKRLILIIFPVIIFTCNIKSQNFHGGLFAGPTITDVNGADIYDGDNDFHKLGYTFGGFVNKKISEKSKMQLEIAYTQKGSSTPPDSTHTNLYYTLVLNYFDINILYKHQIHLNKKNDKDRLGYEIGITTGSLVSSNYSVQSMKQPPLKLNKFQLCYTLGLTYNLSQRIFISGRYSNSIIHAIKRDGFGAPVVYTWNKGNNMVFQIAFGFMLG